MRVKRDQVIERLRLWAARAQHEAQMADTQEDILNWQGQAQVLSGVATYLASAGRQSDEDAVWRQVVADRSNALAAWERAQEGPDAMLYAGMIAGFDVALTALTDNAGRVWTREARGDLWVNR